MTWTNVRLHDREGLWNIAASNGAIAEVSPAEGAWSGQWVLPGFIDAHCHITITGMDLQSLSLAGCVDHEDLLQRVKDRVDSSEETGWLLAVDYNQNLLREQSHITRFQLDAVCPHRPVLLRHVSWHAAVCNTRALEVAGVEPHTKDPQGGKFVRNPNGELSGVLLEDAYKFVSKAVPNPTPEELARALVAAGDAMVRYGVVCATDMFIGRYGLELELEAFRLAYEMGMKIRTRLALDWHQVVGKKRVSRERLHDLLNAFDPNWCKVWGVKLFEDGAIGSGTAAIYGEYATGGGNGILMYPPDRFKDMVVQAHEEGHKVSVHSIGNRCTDVVLDAYEATGDPSVHRLEHAMICSDEQIERIARAGCHVTMQPEFLSHMGTTYQTQLGADVAYRLKRARSFLDAGISLSFNSDRPIVSGDPVAGILAAVDRPQGYDPAENVTWSEALDAYTRMGAVANDEPGFAGEIKVGQRCDLLAVEGESWEAGLQAGSLKVWIDGKSLA